MHTHDTRGGRAEKSSRRYGRRRTGSSGSVFARVIPYRDVFMTDIFTAATADLVATLLQSRRKNLALGGYRIRVRRKQEPAGSDYL